MATCPHCLEEKELFADRCPNCIQEVPVGMQIGTELWLGFVALAAFSFVIWLIIG